MFLKKHTKAIVDNIDQVKNVVANVVDFDSDGGFQPNDRQLIDKIDKILNSNLYDDYHHIAYQRFIDTIAGKLPIESNSHSTYQRFVYCQLRVELIDLLIQIESQNLGIY